MITEAHGEASYQDVLLKKACAACGGSLAVRFTPASARGVCVACHLVTSVSVARTGDGVVIAHLPAAAA